MNFTITATGMDKVGTVRDSRPQTRKHLTFGEWLVGIGKLNETPTKRIGEGNEGNIKRHEGHEGF